MITNPLSRKEYSIWMSATVAFSFTWINFLVLYKNDHLFLQSVTISVINNSSFFDMLISYFRVLLYLPCGFLLIILKLLFCAQRLCDTRLFSLAWPISLVIFFFFWFVNITFPGHLNLVLIIKSCVLTLIGIIPSRQQEVE